MAQTYWSKMSGRRLSRRRAVALTSTTAAGAALLAACSGGKSSPSGNSNGGSSSLISQPVDTSKQAKRGGVLKDRTFGDPPTLDPVSPVNPLNPPTSHIYSSLVQFKPGYLKTPETELIPDVAESWETAPDGLQVTMKLRPGVKWHNKAPVNGRLLDIDDVVFSWNRFAAKSAGRATVANSADPRAPVLSVTAADAKTVVIKLKEPIVYVLGLFGSNHTGGTLMYPKEADATLDVRSEMIGTGPFMLSNYSPSVGFTLKRNPDYWDKDYALVDQVELPILAEYAATLAQFKAGNIFSFGSLSSVPKIRAEDVLTIKKEEPRILIFPGDLTGAGNILNFGWLPAGKSPFLDVRVRQAVSMAWDRDLFMDTFFNIPAFAGQGLPITTRWNTALSGVNEGWWLDPKGKDFGPNSQYFQHNVAEAKKLMAAAGYPNGIQDLISNYVAGPELPGADQDQALDGMVNDIGMRVKAHPVDYAKDYIPIYRDGHGQFEGWAYTSAGGGQGKRSESWPTSTGRRAAPLPSTASVPADRTTSQATRRSTPCSNEAVSSRTRRSEGRSFSTSSAISPRWLTRSTRRGLLPGSRSPGRPWVTSGSISFFRPSIGPTFKCGSIKRSLLSRAPKRGTKCSASRTTNFSAGSGQAPRSATSCGTTGSRQCVRTSCRCRIRRRCASDSSARTLLPSGRARARWD
jgi:peptide/nickel transport system substrate-binding protein